MSKLPRTKRVQGQYTAPLVKVVRQQEDRVMNDHVLTLSCGHQVRKAARGADRFTEWYCIACSPEYKAWIAESMREHAGNSNPPQEVTNASNSH